MAVKSNETAPKRTVALDASVLINFLHMGRLDLLADLPGFEFAVPEQVAEEVTYPEQAASLATALENGLLLGAGTGGIEELSAYGELLETMGRGEAACIAIAAKRGWWVATDDRGPRVLRAIGERLGGGRRLDTPGIMLLAIRAGLLPVDEADRLKTHLETARRFRMDFYSFRDLDLPEG